jgi:sugar/nucleoside kinase (ribokinase family)
MDELNYPNSLGIGSVLVDHVFEVDELPVGPGYPEPGQKKQVDDLDIELLLSSLNLEDASYIQLGGPVPTALSVHSYWSPFFSNVNFSFYASVGDDPLGARIRQDVLSRGLSPSFVMRENTSSPKTVVWVRKSDGARSILYSRGNVGQLTESDAHLLFAKYPLPTSRPVLHVDATEPTAVKIAAQKIHDETNGYVYLDTGDFKVYPDGTNVTDLLLYADVIQTPLRCALRLAAQIRGDKTNIPAAMITTDHLAEIIREYASAGMVIVTDGTNGFGFSSQRHDVNQKGRINAWTAPIPTFPDEVRDETGAGDILAGTISFGLAAGEDILDALQIAAVVAASSTRRLGNAHFLNYLDSRELVLGQGLDLS